MDEQTREHIMGELRAAINESLRVSLIAGPLHLVHHRVASMGLALTIDIDFILRMTENEAPAPADDSWIKNIGVDFNAEDTRT